MDACTAGAKDEDVDNAPFVKLIGFIGIEDRHSSFAFFVFSYLE